MAAQHRATDSTVASSGLPTNDYLWQSSLGRAFPGSHHQFILHLLAVQYASSDVPLVDINRIKTQLDQIWSGFTISAVELRDVAQEFVALQLDMKLAYQDQRFREPMLRRDASAASPENTAQSFDPAMFEQLDVEQMRYLPNGADRDSMTFTPVVFSPFTLRSRPNAVPEESADVPPTRLSPRFNDRVSSHDDCGSTDVSVNETTTTPSSKCNTPLTSPLQQDCNASRHPVMTESNFANIASNISAANTSTIMVTIDDNVNVTPTNARVYAPLYLAALTQSRYGKTSISFALEPEEFQEKVVSTVPDSSMPGDLSLVTRDNGNGVAEHQDVKIPVRRPDPSRYSTSDSRLVVPASEADSYMAWYNPATDRIPEKMEGYCWYCEKCYISPAERTGANKRLGGDRVKGKYPSKTSMEKHVSTIHKEKWKPAMPEKDREPGTLSIPQIIVTEDADQVLQAHDDHDALGGLQGDPVDHDRRSLDGLRTLDSPALMSLGANYKYQPTKVKRKLFRDEIALRESHVNQGTLTEKGALDFDDIERGKENLPASRMSGYGGKQAAWETAGLDQNPSLRKVGFAKGRDVRVYDTRANAASITDLVRQRATLARLARTPFDRPERRKLYVDL